MTSSLVLLFWIRLGRLFCICRLKSNSARAGSLLSVGVDLRQRRTMFGSELGLCAFFKSFLTILTWLSMNPLLFGQLGVLVTCLDPCSAKIDGSDPGSEVHYLIPRLV